MPILQSTPRQLAPRPEPLHLRASKEFPRHLHLFILEVCDVAWIGMYRNANRLEPALCVSTANLEPDRFSFRRDLFTLRRGADRHGAKYELVVGTASFGVSEDEAKQIEERFKDHGLRIEQT